MLKKISFSLRNYDWWLFASVIILITIGILIIYSVGMNSDTSDLTRFYKQVIFALIGLIALFTVSFIDYRIFNNYAYLLYIFGILLLISVLIFGTTIRGTTGWFSFGFISFQPVELGKIILVIMLARFFSIKGYEMDKIVNIIFSALISGSYVLLVMRQPDLGSALIFMALWVGFLFLSNIKKSQFLILLLILAVLATCSWFLILKDYQKERILTFINPSRDPLVTGYNVIQSVTAVGSGGLIGRGLGLGPQSQLNFLPEQENDFIFAVIAEELGFIGSGFVIILFFSIFYRIWKLSKIIKNDFTVYLLYGILIILCVQTTINIGMNIGIMPVTGLPLPFISSGGSSLVVNLILVGIIENVYQKNHLT
ncbi:MAG: rod shape-determining protein RodA [Patescibacteria group bacterium]